MPQPYPRLCTLTACLLLAVCEQPGDTGKTERPVRQERFAGLAEGIPAADNELAAVWLEGIYRLQATPETPPRQPVESIGGTSFRPRAADSVQLVF